MPAQIQREVLSLKEMAEAKEQRELRLGGGS